MFWFIRGHYRYHRSTAPAAFSKSSGLSDSFLAGTPSSYQGSGNRQNIDCTPNSLTQRLSHGLHRKYTDLLTPWWLMGGGHTHSGPSAWYSHGEHALTSPRVRLVPGVHWEPQALPCGTETRRPDSFKLLGRTGVPNPLANADPTPELLLHSKPKQDPGIGLNYSHGWPCWRANSWTVSRISEERYFNSPHTHTPLGNLLTRNVLNTNE